MEDSATLTMKPHDFRLQKLFQSVCRVQPCCVHSYAVEFLCQLRFLRPVLWILLRNFDVTYEEGISIVLCTFHFFSFLKFKVKIVLKNDLYLFKKM